MECIIRTHQPGDIGWIISKHGEIYTQEFNFDPSFEVHIANKFVYFFRDEKSAFDSIWIAEVANQRAGSISVWERSTHEAFINFVLVLDEFRGNGIAKLLLDKVINHCKANHYTTIALETYSSLQGARKIYDKSGFKITKEYKNQQLFGQTLDQEFWEMKL